MEKETQPAPAAAGTVDTLADPGFTKRMEKSAAASEAALEELEEAMEAADRTQKVSSSILDTPPKPVTGDKGPKPE